MARRGLLLPACLWDSPSSAFSRRKRQRKYIQLDHSDRSLPVFATCSSQAIFPVAEHNRLIWLATDWSTFSPTVKSQSRYVMNEMTISEGKQWTGRDQLGTLHVADNGRFLICRSAVAKVFLIDARMWVVARVFWVVTGLSCVVALLLWAVAAVQCSGLLPGCSRWLLGLC